MVMLSAPEGAGEITDALAALVEGLDVAVIGGDDAARLTALFARGERRPSTGAAICGPGQTQTAPAASTPA
jgi:hypothetical protein